jgi:hypothetical protein
MYQPGFAVYITLGPLSMLPPFPAQVISYVRGIFAGANRRVSEKLARVPNCSEPSLDLTLIEHLTRYAAPRVVAPGWTVKLDVHFLGGLRHFHRWEIADIGVLVFAKQGAHVVGRKVALLQSKRLYPQSHAVIEEELVDYQIGFANLLPTGPSAQSIATPHAFKFTDASMYKALRSEDDQYKAIRDYEAQKHIPVHYLFYNPWVVPATYPVPTPGSFSLGPRGNGGCRVVRSQDLRSVMLSKNEGTSPKFAEVAGLCGSAAAHLHGWRLEQFVAGLVMRCKEGHVFTSMTQDIESLFYRRSGPIAAAMSITVEGPSAS